MVYNELDVASWITVSPVCMPENVIVRGPPTEYVKIFESASIYISSSECFGKELLAF